MLYAIRETDVKEITFDEVTFYIKALPYSVKKDLMYQSMMEFSDGTQRSNQLKVLTEAIKYGVSGWKGLMYEDGESVEPIFTQCPTYKVSMLSQESFELLYRSSIFYGLASMCLDNTIIPKHIKESTEKRKSNRKELEDLKKK